MIFSEFPKKIEGRMLKVCSNCKKGIVCFINRNPEIFCKKKNCVRENNKACDEWQEERHDSCTVSTAGWRYFKKRGKWN